MVNTTMQFAVEALEKKIVLEHDPNAAAAALIGGIAGFYEEAITAAQAAGATMFMLKHVRDLEDVLKANSTTLAAAVAAKAAPAEKADVAAKIEPKEAAPHRR
jgi:hypothetical protein